MSPVSPSSKSKGNVDLLSVNRAQLGSCGIPLSIVVNLTIELPFWDSIYNPVFLVYSGIPGITILLEILLVLFPYITYNHYIDKIPKQHLPKISETMTCPISNNDTT